MKAIRGYCRSCKKVQPMKPLNAKRKQGDNEVSTVKCLACGKVQG